MAYNDRIRNARYVSPSGAEFDFLYQDLSRSFEKKHTVFEFIGEAGAYVQDFGKKGNRYPIRVIFSGADYDLIADSFYKALQERGGGTLEHPSFGRLVVNPIRVNEKRDFVNDAGNVAFDIEFVETSDKRFPKTQADIVAEGNERIDEYENAASGDLSRNLEKGLGDRRDTIVSLRGFLDNVDDAFSEIAKTTEDINRRFQGIVNEINSAITILIDNPVRLTAQVIALLKAPARAGVALKSRWNGYKSLLQEYTTPPKSRNLTQTEAGLNQLYLQASFSAFGDGVLNAPGVIDTRAEAADIKDELAEEFISYSVFLDEQENSSDFTRTNETSDPIDAITNLSNSRLIDALFVLPQEFRTVIEEPIDIISACNLFYPNERVDDKIDFFISTNGFRPNDAFLIPRNRQVVFYR